MQIAVTGAYGFSGKYIAWRLLDLKHDVITLTNLSQRGNPFGESVKAFPYNFSKPHELENSFRKALGRPTTILAGIAQGECAPFRQPSEGLRSSR
jgi:nucleoside-diphosphate-sugar epimerase